MRAPVSNVRVAVRCRPLAPRELLENSETCVELNDFAKTVTMGKKTFTFDFAFGPQTTQTTIYDMCVEQLVEGCFTGLNATVFAYGQTGAGKTYTMGSGDSTGARDAEVGIIPRSIDEIFSKVEALGEDVDVTLRVSYLELYRETLIDLIREQPQPGESASNDAVPLSIREDGTGSMVVAGLTSLAVTSREEMLAVLHDGSVWRTTGSTKMNARSSRSHAIFTIHVEVRSTGGSAGAAAADDDDAAASGSLDDLEVSTASVPTPRKPRVTTAKFHLVDLAGSERAKRTGARGVRLQESIRINEGLLALGNVISALGDTRKQKRGISLHVNYRDSKLTRLLQDSLGGNSQTLMIACVSPAAPDFAETLNALKYANRARRIRNKPIVNEVRSASPATVARLHRQLESLQNQVRRHEEEDELLRGMRDDERAAAPSAADYRRAVDRLQRVAALLRELADVGMAASHTIAEEPKLGELAATLRRLGNAALDELASHRPLAATVPPPAAAEAAGGAGTPSSGGRGGDETARRLELPLSQEARLLEEAQAQLRAERQRFADVQGEMKRMSENLRRDEEIFEHKNEQVIELQSMFRREAAKRSELEQRLGDGGAGNAAAASASASVAAASASSGPGASTTNVAGTAEVEGSTSKEEGLQSLMTMRGVSGVQFMHAADARAATGTGVLGTPGGASAGNVGWGMSGTLLAAPSPGGALTVRRGELSLQLAMGEGDLDDVVCALDDADDRMGHRSSLGAGGGAGRQRQVRWQDGDGETSSIVIAEENEKEEGAEDAVADLNRSQTWRDAMKQVEAVAARNTIRRSMEGSLRHMAEVEAQIKLRESDLAALTLRKMRADGTATGDLPAGETQALDELEDQLDEFRTEKDYLQQRVLQLEAKSPRRRPRKGGDMSGGGDAPAPQSLSLCVGDDVAVAMESAVARIGLSPEDDALEAVRMLQHIVDDVSLRLLRSSLHRASSVYFLC